MGSLIEATKVGDRYRDSSGNVATIVHMDDSRVIVRRKGRGFPLYSVFGPDFTGVIASGLRSLDAALSA